MKNRIVALVASVAAICGFGMLTAPPAMAGSNTSCTNIDATAAQDPQVCLNMTWTRPATGKIRLQSLKITCNRVVFNHPAIIPIEFWVHGSNGLTVWNSGGGGWECGEERFPNAITCSCANLQAHLFGRADLAWNNDDQFVVNTYS